MLRVMTLNIWNLSGPWRERRVEIAAWLGRLAPDVVCLQEVMQAPDGRNQARWLAECDGVADLGYDVAWGAELDLGVQLGRFGNAVLSRWPIETSKTFPLPDGGRDREHRVVVHARTAGLDVFSTHLNWRFDHGVVREEQVVALVDAIESAHDSSSPYPPIVAGDFNAEPDSTEIRFLTGSTSMGGRSVYFQDSWRVAGGRGPGWTWDNRNPFANSVHEPDRRIDYVFVGPWRADGAGRVESARVVCDRALGGVFASDHFGVLAEITGPPLAPAPGAPPP